MVDLAPSRGKEVLRADGITIEARHRRRGRGVIARDVSLAIHEGEIVGLIGESGSGKTLTAKALLGLLPRGVRASAGSARLKGVDLLSLAPDALRRVRGEEIALIPQDALHALNPVMTVGAQVGEPFVIHRGAKWAAALRQAVDLLALVQLPEPEKRIAEYPHQFSGGMQQRAMIAMGLALGPSLIVADEPTTALDVTVQARILALVRQLRDRTGAAFLFITHDLGIVGELCDWVYVMYAGQVVEAGATRRIFADPRHPYTRALIAATPPIARRADRLAAIPGQIPSPFEPTPGCRFAARCTRLFARCAAEPPPVDVAPGHMARCWLAEDGHG